MSFLSTQIKPSSVFIVIPAYNEEAAIVKVINELLVHRLSIVVVDDGSVTPLYDSLVGMPVYLLRHPVNLGQGAALQTGIEYALAKGAAYIVTFDADGQHTVSALPSLFKVMQETGVAIVMGSRFLQSSSSQVPFWRSILLQSARLINFLFTGFYLTDAHNGLRLLSRQAAEKIVLQQNGMAHATEILWQIKKERIRYKEAPVQILYTDYSLEKGQNGWSGFRILLDLLLHKLFR